MDLILCLLTFPHEWTVFYHVFKHIKGHLLNWECDSVESIPSTYTALLSVPGTVYIVLGGTGL